MSSQVDVLVQSPNDRQVVVTYTGGQTVMVAAAVTANIVTASTERVDVQQLGIIGPAGPPGEDLGLDIDQYGRVVLDGGPPNLTNGA